MRDTPPMCTMIVQKASSLENFLAAFSQQPAHPPNPLARALSLVALQAEHVSEFAGYPVSQSVSSNSGAGSSKGEGRLFCWQAYLKEE